MVLGERYSLSKGIIVLDARNKYSIRQQRFVRLKHVNIFGEDTT